MGASIEVYSINYFNSIFNLLGKRVFVVTCLTQLSFDIRQEPAMDQLKLRQCLFSAYHVTSRFATRTLCPYNYLNVQTSKKCKDVSPFSGEWNFIVILKSLHTIESVFKETAAMLARLDTDSLYLFHESGFTLRLKSLLRRMEKCICALQQLTFFVGWLKSPTFVKYKITFFYFTKINSSRLNNNIYAKL